MKGSPLSERAGLVIIADAAEVARFEAQARGTAVPVFSTIAIDAGAAVPSPRLHHAQLLILEVDPADPASMHRLERLRVEQPALAVIAAVRDATVSLMRMLVRQGIADVIALPLQPQEVTQAALDASARQPVVRTAQSRPAPIVSVVQSIGGCGATTIATHLAAALGEDGVDANGAMLADLDIQFGTVTDYLNVDPRGYLDDLLNADSRLDEELLASVAAKVSPRLSVISAPQGIMPIEQIEAEQLLNILSLVRQQYGVVVLDLPAVWTNWSLSVAAESSLILMVVEQTLPSLRQAKRRLELFRSVGIEESSVEIVVNRAQKRLFASIDVNDVERALAHRVLGSVTLDVALVTAAQNQRQLVQDVRRKSPFGTDIAKIAAQVRARLAGQAT
jgi:pilus assembly protein CpaE